MFGLIFFELLLANGDLFRVFGTMIMAARMSARAVGSTDDGHKSHPFELAHASLNFARAEYGNGDGACLLSKMHSVHDLVVLM